MKQSKIPREIQNSIFMYPRAWILSLSEYCRINLKNRLQLAYNWECDNGAAEEAPTIERSKIQKTQLFDFIRATVKSLTNMKNKWKIQVTAVKNNLPRENWFELFALKGLVLGVECHSLTSHLLLLLFSSIIFLFMYLLLYRFFLSFSFTKQFNNTFSPFSALTLHT